MIPFDELPAVRWFRKLEQKMSKIECTDLTPVIEELREEVALWQGGSIELFQKVLAAYGTQRDKINDSDLDDEQPISLTIRMTLGDVKRIRRAVLEANHRPADFKPIGTVAHD